MTAPKMTLEQLKAAFAKPTRTGGDPKWKRRYDFWKMNFGDTATVRFLPDGDTDNPMAFMTENLTHRLQVNGKMKVVPCLTMYGKTCPCCQLSAQFYAQGDETSGKKYYKKREYLAPVLVIKSPFEIENPEEAKIVSMGSKLFKLIQEAFAGEDLEIPPYGLGEGYDFRIKKSQQGEYADYTLSSFAPKITKLDEDLAARIELLNLKDYRTEEISAEALEAMIIADQTGTEFQETRTETVSRATPAPAAAVVEDEVVQVSRPAAPAAPAPTAPAAPAAGNSAAANSILETIRARMAAQQAGE